MNWRFAALLVCLVGAAQAESDVYRYYIPHPGPAAKIEWSSPGAGWDVTVGFDSERCEIYCIYRRVHDPFGPTALTHFMLPPPTVIRVSRDSTSKPETVIVDPAGLRQPRIAGRERPCPDHSGIPGRGLTAIARLSDSPDAAGRPSHALPILATRERDLPAAAPLRI